MLHSTLVLERVILDTHDDYSPWSGLSCGFDDDRNFVVVHNFEEEILRYFWQLQVPAGPSRRITVTRLSISFNDAFLLAKRMRCAVTALPEAFDEEFGGPLDESTANVVDELFNEIWAFLNSFGFKVRRDKQVYYDD